MNLYRSFGNLLEIWVTDRAPFSDLRAENGHGCDHAGSAENCGSAPDLGIHLRSESEDSGVEMTSSHTSLSSPRGIWPGAKTNAEPVFTGREEDRSPGTTPLTPPLSSLEPSVEVPSEGSSVSLHRRVERALLRTDPGRQGAVSRQTKCGRSESCVSRKPASQQRLEQCRRPLSLCHDKPPTQPKTEQQSAAAAVAVAVAAAGGDALSPGLSYLEQVCRMLEEIARLQRRNHGLQTEMDSLKEHQAKRHPESRPCDCTTAADDVSVSERLGAGDLERISAGSLRCSSLDFRQRSASDTRVLETKRLRNVLPVPSTRGQHVNENVLAEQTEEQEETQETQEEKKSKRWTIRKSSSKREGMSHSWDSKENSQGTRPPERGTPGHRLRQLFRGRGKTLPA